MRRTILIIASLVSLTYCSTPAERAAQELARRVVPEYAGKIIFKEVPDTVECYSIEAQGRKVLIKGSGTNAMAVVPEMTAVSYPKRMPPSAATTQRNTTYPIFTDLLIIQCIYYNFINNCLFIKAELGIFV